MCPKYVKPRLEVLDVSDSSSLEVEAFSLIFSHPVDRREKASTGEDLRPLSGLLLTISHTPNLPTIPSPQLQTQRHLRLWSDWQNILKERERRGPQGEIPGSHAYNLFRGSKRRRVAMTQPSSPPHSWSGFFEDATRYSWGGPPLVKVSKGAW